MEETLHFLAFPEFTLATVRLGGWLTIIWLQESGLCVSREAPAFASVDWCLFVKREMFLLYLFQNGIFYNPLVPVHPYERN